jgi:hypothetical protein
MATSFDPKLGSSSGHNKKLESCKNSFFNLGFVVPCIFRYSIKHPTRCTINLIFIALSRRHRSTCFGHYCAHHQEPPPTAFAASGYRMIAGLDVFQAVVGFHQQTDHSLKHVQPGSHTVTRSCKGSWRGS